MIYTSNTTLNDPTFGDPFTLVYVDGDLTLQGTVTGTGTIVVDGEIEIDGDLAYAPAGQNKIALIATGQIEIARTVQTVNGILYAQGGRIRVRQPGPALSVPAGVLAGDHLDIQRDLHVARDPDLTDQMKEALQLPGYTP